MKQSLALMLPDTLSLTVEGQPAVLPTLSFCSDTVRSFSLNHLKLQQSEERRTVSSYLPCGMGAITKKKKKMNAEKTVVISLLKGWDIHVSLYPHVWKDTSAIRRYKWLSFA